jgi:hypothetical protein
MDDKKCVKMKDLRRGTDHLIFTNNGYNRDLVMDFMKFGTYENSYHNCLLSF